MVITEITSSRLGEPHELALATEMIANATGQGISVRLLGGLAVATRSRSALSRAPLTRNYSDIDLITRREEAPSLASALEGLGFVPERRFNAMHGHSRMMFADPTGLHVDLFIDRFAMCHQLDLRSRLDIHKVTLSLADLLLTKLQVAQLTAKDVADVAALLLDHPLSEDEDGINVTYVADILSHDWGWWRTVSYNLAIVPHHLPTGLGHPDVTQVSERTDQLQRIITDAPKSLRWRARAKAGDRVPWREEPEETH